MKDSHAGDDFMNYKTEHSLPFTFPELPEI